MPCYFRSCCRAETSVPVDPSESVRVRVGAVVVVFDAADAEETPRAARSALSSATSVATSDWSVAISEVVEDEAVVWIAAMGVDEDAGVAAETAWSRSWDAKPIDCARANCVPMAANEIIAANTAAHLRI